MEKYFLHQIKHTGDTWDKGIVIKDTWDAIRQSYHAYLGAYAYGYNADTDYVQAEITDMAGNRLLIETWDVIETPEVN